MSVRSWACTGAKSVVLLAVEGGRDCPAYSSCDDEVSPAKLQWVSRSDAAVEGACCLV